MEAYKSLKNLYFRKKHKHLIAGYQKNFEFLLFLNISLNFHKNILKLLKALCI